MQDKAWEDYEINAEWGDQRFEIRNYLQTEWEKKEFTKSLPYNLENMKNTAERILKVSLIFGIAMTDK